MEVLCKLLDEVDDLVLLMAARLWVPGTWVRTLAVCLVWVQWAPPAVNAGERFAAAGLAERGDAEVIALESRVTPAESFDP